ncbi:MAG: hypothetical protein DMF61_27055 [Blastocatellia bacterium AA13]|nr:MAG: hypothetical protein DMF61_27055 [Blastocatellia bacterium AA13]
MLQPLIDFIASRGRLPEAEELDILPEIRSQLGRVGRAFALIRRFTGEDQWSRIREERSQDVLVYLALSKFGGRPRQSQLDPAIRLDVRAFFSTYSRACDLADKLLFSAGR